MIRGMTVYPFPVFDIERVLDIVEREKITVLPGAPTIYHELLAAHRRGGHDLSSLRVAVTGAADIPVELIRRIKEELPFQSIMTGYGLTEAGTITASRPGDSFEDIATTVGTPCDGFELRIASDGEVLARGFAVMKGYFDDPAATAEAIDADGWLHTGDLGTIDGGPPEDHRPQEGHVHRRRLQRLPGRDRRLPARAPRRRPGRRDRRPRRAPGPGRQGLHRPAEPGAVRHRAGAHRLVEDPHGRLQGPPLRGLPRQPSPSTPPARS